MTLTTLSFFVFLSITLIIYYGFGHFLGGGVQKYILLLASIFFYFSAAGISRIKVAVILSYIIGVTYAGAIFIDRAGHGKLRRLAAFLVVSALVSVLAVLKYLYNLGNVFNHLFALNADLSFLMFSSLIGISYYTLSAIGYVLDVSWETYEAEKNPCKIALFILFFPQMVSGPFTRYADMKKELFVRHSLDYDTFAAGLRRMLYGYFKKLVISERFALLVTGITENYASYAGAWIWAAMAAYGVRLYTDFSGCMDIVLGAAQMFGIRLPENFRAPFSSRTIQEFWQRWHITLGTWFKDYFMYPLQKSNMFVSIGKKCRKRFGKKAGKKIPLYIAMLFLWILLGIWHGGTVNYLIAAGVLQFAYIAGGDMLSPLLAKVRCFFHIRDDAAEVIIFQRARTLFLMMTAWTFFVQSSFMSVLQMLKYSVLHFFSGVQKMDFALLGIGKRDIMLSMLGLFILWIAGYYGQSDSSIHEEMNKRPILSRYVVTCLEVLVIMRFAMVGQSEFVYFQF